MLFHQSSGKPPPGNGIMVVLCWKFSYSGIQNWICFQSKSWSNFTHWIFRIDIQEAKKWKWPSVKWNFVLVFGHFYGNLLWPLNYGCHSRDSLQPKHFSWKARLLCQINRKLRRKKGKGVFNLQTLTSSCRVNQRGSIFQKHIDAETMYHHLHIMYK